MSRASMAARFPFSAWSVVVFSALCSACAGPFAEGMRDYDHGRYPQALDELRDVETDSLQWRERERVRYALYRGLTHLALGDRAATWRWLDEVHRASLQNPKLLSD